MPFINCPTCDRSIDLPLEYLSIWVECKDCAQQFLPLTGDKRQSVLNEKRSFECQACAVQFTTFAAVSSNRPRCTQCGSSDTLPSEVAAYFKAHPLEQKPKELFNPNDPKLGEAPTPLLPNKRVKLPRKTRDDRSGLWIVALITGVVLVFGGTVLLLVALLTGKNEVKKAKKTAPSPPSQARPRPETTRERPTDPAPQPDVSWKRFASEDGRLRITMPSPVVERSRQMETLAGTVRETQFLYEKPGAAFTYSIAFADFSPAQLGDKTLEHIIDDNRDQLIRKHRGRLQGDKVVELNQYLGREIDIESPDRHTVLCRYYKAGTRLYTLIVAGKGADFGMKEIDTFFDSFEITGSTR